MNLFFLSLQEPGLFLMEAVHCSTPPQKFLSQINRLIPHEKYA